MITSDYQTYDLNLETFISGILMIFKNKQRNQYYCCTSYVTLFETVWTGIDTVGLFNTDQDTRKVPLGYCKWWLRPVNRGDGVTEVKITVILLRVTVYYGAA